MFNTIIFSKDRPMQLDLLLRSIQKYASFLEPTIIYTFTNSMVNGKGYEKLKSMYPKFNFVYQSKALKEHIISLINHNNEFTIFFVDDMFFINELDLQSMKFIGFANINSILALSLRLGRHINYCYPSNKSCAPPEINNGLFNYKTGHNYWSYPMSLDGNIYRTNEISELINNIQFNNPNELEYQLALNPISNKTSMICFDQAKVINLAINKVQTYNNNKSGKVSPLILNYRFLKGERISLDRMAKKCQNQNSCHIETELIFEK